ncbi:MAG: phosphoribosylformylglycinamidine synthase subunit PurQ, partial [Oscillospiraceae bacterium]|nr:phosphoribosylformylglycinamidine synthase subunit PurQ [Oscillospiraceae bacterium]
FAVTTGKVSDAVSPEFKQAGHRVVWIAPEDGPDGLPEAGSLKRAFARVTALFRSGKAVACMTPGIGGVGEAVMKMGFGNGLGFRFAPDWTAQEIFARTCGRFLVEVTEDVGERTVGFVTDDGAVSLGGESVPLAELLSDFEGKLESVYPAYTAGAGGRTETFAWRGECAAAPAVRAARPKILIPVFPGTNCEYDSARAVADAGAEPEIVVIRNLSAEDIRASIDRFAASLRTAQAVFVPGGFSGGDEPDGSGKFITAFFRNDAIRDGVSDLLDVRGGLMCGICNGFQALIKLGLVPYGRIVEPDENAPTLTFNTIARHQSRIVRTRVASRKSPWLALAEEGGVYSVPISHGEGRFLAPEETIRALAANGQIATQYVDLDGEATMDIRFNPNGSLFAVEGITSPDGRVFGKMGHAERVGGGLYRNVPGNYDLRMFEAAVRYFQKI